MSPFERGDETPIAWAAFKTFRDLGATRTLKMAAAIHYGYTEDTLPRHRYEQFRRWSAKHGWITKAESYDALFDMARSEAVAEHVKARATSFEERRLRLLETRLEIAEEIAQRMREMAASPIYAETTVEDGETGEVTIVRNPAGWSFSTLSRLDAIVAGITQGVEPEIIIDWSTVDEPELDRIGRGEDPRVVLPGRDEHGRLVGSAGRDDE